MKKKGILIYGLQRSGTNFLENLLKKNYYITILNENAERSSPGQKHFRLYDQKDIIPRQHYYNDYQYNTFFEFEKSLTDIPDGYLIISKDPYSWHLSYKNWAMRCNWPDVEHHYIQEYNLFYRKWLDFSQTTDRISFIRYIDLLRMPDVELEKISIRIGLKGRLISTFISNQIPRVSHSDIFTKRRREYYLKQQYLDEYQPYDLDEINSLLDDSVVNDLGYQKEDQISKKNINLSVK